MRIGVDASCWSNRRGFGRFTRELLRALLEIDKDNRYFFLIDRHSSISADLPPQALPIVVRTRHAPTSAAAAEGFRSISDILRMSFAASAHFDLFFFPAVYSYFPLWPGTKCIVTFHDAIAEKYPKLIFPNLRARFFWNAKSWIARNQADVVLTVSKYARDSLISQWNLDPENVRVISEAPSPIFRQVEDSEQLLRVLQRLGLPPTTAYLLYVGGISPHKNLERLINVFNRIVQPPKSSRLRLLLVGDYERDVFFSSFTRLREIVHSLRKESEIIFTNYVPDEDLVHLYNGAVALVLPSLEEGFGLPAVEAIACGTPVVASGGGSLQELLCDAGLFFDPRSEEDLERVLVRLLGDEALRESLSSQALKRAQEFSWKRSAAILKEIFEETVAR